MKPEFFDAHGHLNFVAYDSDREEVIKRTLDSGVFVNCVGTQKDTSKSAVDLANKFGNGFYATIGLHPIHTGKSFHDEKELGKGGVEFTSRGEIFDYDYYKNLAKDEKVIAIGECGLDFFRLDEESSSKKQKEAFNGQIELAKEVSKPLMLHIRNGSGISAYNEAYDVLKPHIKSNPSLIGDLHFFAGSIEEARQFLDAGFYFSFTGVVTFARNYDEVIKFLPLERILSETDCPYVTPHPYRGKRNEPVYVKEVVKKIAEIKGESFLKTKEILLKNAETFFRIKL
jgi:TatD DNase family protein